MQISEERVDLRAGAVRAARGKSGVACTCVLGHAWSARGSKPGKSDSGSGGLCWGKKNKDRRFRNFVSGYCDVVWVDVKVDAVADW